MPISISAPLSGRLLRLVACLAAPIPCLSGQVTIDDDALWTTLSTSTTDAVKTEPGHLFITHSPATLNLQAGSAAFTRLILAGPTPLTVDTAITTAAGTQVSFVNFTALPAAMPATSVSTGAEVANAATALNTWLGGITPGLTFRGSVTGAGTVSFGGMVRLESDIGTTGAVRFGDSLGVAATFEGVNISSVPTFLQLATNLSSRPITAYGPLAISASGAARTIHAAITSDPLGTSTRYLMLHGDQPLTFTANLSGFTAFYATTTAALQMAGLTLSGQGNLISSPATVEFTGALDGADTVTLIKSGSGDLKLGAAGNFSGQLAAFDGNVRVGHADALDTSYVLLSETAKLTLEASTVKVGGLAMLSNQTEIALGGNTLEIIGRSDSPNVLGRLTGVGAVRVTGAQTLQVAGNAGAGVSFDFRGGPVQVDGALLGSATIGNGVALQGSGSMGTTQVSQGGMLFGGNDGAGTLTLASLTLAAGAQLGFQLAPAQLAAGTGYGLLSVTGSTTFNATAAQPWRVVPISLLDAGHQFAAGSVHRWDLLTAQSFSGFDIGAVQFDTQYFPHAGNWSVIREGGTLTLQFSAIPEPSSYAAFVSGAAALAAVLRRSRRSRRNPAHPPLTA